MVWRSRCQSFSKMICHCLRTSSPTFSQGPDLFSTLYILAFLERFTCVGWFLISRLNDRRWIMVGQNLGFCVFFLSCHTAVLLTSPAMICALFYLIHLTYGPDRLSKSSSTLCLYRMLLNQYGFMEFYVWFCFSLGVVGSKVPQNPMTATANPLGFFQEKTSMK